MIGREATIIFSRVDADGGVREARSQALERAPITFAP
jgi:hypothetical protein